MLVSDDLCHFLYFRNDLEYHYVPVPQEVFIGYDQTIANDVGRASLKLMLHQFWPVYHHFLFDLSLYDHISDATSTFQLHSQHLGP
jgi:hypothetical protein